MSPTTTSLALRGLETAGLVVLPELEQERDALLARASKPNTITGPDGAQRAVELQRELQAFSSRIETMRKDAKEPLLELTRQLDDTAKGLVADINHHAKRIGDMVGQWTEAQRQREEDARRKAWEEQERIRKAAEVAERAEQERLRRADEDRIAALRAAQEVINAKARAEQEELERKASAARSEKRRAELEAQAAGVQARAEAQAREAEAQALADQLAAEKKALEEGLKRDEATAQAMADTTRAAAAIRAHRPVGVATRREPRFEVTDIHALHDACPGLVILSPNNAAIKAKIKELAEGQSLPGVRHYWEVSSAPINRGAPKAIDV